jgi:tripeptidyl-peptidase I
MRVTCVALALLLAATAQGAAVPNSHVVHEKRDVPPSKWVKREKVSSSYILPMRIGLKQRNLDRGDEFLMDV